MLNLRQIKYKHSTMFSSTQITASCRFLSKSCAEVSSYKLAKKYSVYERGKSNEPTRSQTGWLKNSREGETRKYTASGGSGKAIVVAEREGRQSERKRGKKRWMKSAGRIEVSRIINHPARSFPPRSAVNRALSEQSYKTERPYVGGKKDRTGE